MYKLKIDLLKKICKRGFSTYVNLSFYHPVGLVSGQILTNSPIIGALRRQPNDIQLKKLLLHEQYLGGYNMYIMLCK